MCYLEGRNMCIDILGYVKLDVRWCRVIMSLVLFSLCLCTGACVVARAVVGVEFVAVRPGNRTHVLCIVHLLMDGTANITSRPMWLHIT